MMLVLGPGLLAGAASGMFLAGIFMAIALAIGFGGLAFHVNRAREANLREARDLWGLTGVIMEGRAWPAPGGWALGADALTLLLRELPLRHAKTVVELGPGTSSIVLGRCLPDLAFYGLEHDERFLHSVSATLSQHDLRDYHLIHAPLKPTLSHGREVQWYDTEKIAQLPDSIDVLIVDGPPNLQGLGNRAPAWPLLSSRFSEGGLVLVDDTHRPNERAMADEWLKDEDLHLLWDYGSFMVLEKGRVNNTDG